MAKPVILVTRKLPEAIEARLTEVFDAKLNTADSLWGRAGAEVAARAKARGAAGILCAAGDAMNAAAINALPESVKVISTFSVGFDHIAIDAARAWHCRDEYARSAFLRDRRMRLHPDADGRPPRRRR